MLIVLMFSCTLSEHKTWFQAKNANVASYHNQVVAVTRTADINDTEGEAKRNEVQFNAVRISIDEIEKQQLVRIFKNILKEKFLVFELDIQFLIIKVIMAIVDINKIFMDNNNEENRTYFHVQVYKPHHQKHGLYLLYLKHEEKFIVLLQTYLQKFLQ